MSIVHSDVHVFHKISPEAAKRLEPVSAGGPGPTSKESVYGMNLFDDCGVCRTTIEDLGALTHAQRDSS